MNLAKRFTREYVELYEQRSPVEICVCDKLGPGQAQPWAPTPLAHSVIIIDVSAFRTVQAYYSRS